MPARTTRQRFRRRVTQTCGLGRAVPLALQSIHTGVLAQPGCARGDFHADVGPLGGDGVLERSDFELWFDCASPPVRPTDAAKTSADCLCTFNADGDVDLADFARLQNPLGAGGD